MEYYNKEIKDNSQVEFVLMAGESEDGLAAWAKKESMPWPMLTKDDYSRMKVIKDLKVRKWPSYFLLDAEGEILVNDGSSHEIKAKIKELTADATS